METHAALRYAFVDESGTASPFSGSRHLVIALLATPVPREIELHVKRMHKKHGTSLSSGEMKAGASREAVVAQLLQALAGEQVEYMAVIVDKAAIVRSPADPEDIYRKAVALAVAHAVRRWPRLNVCLDKRYTARKLVDRLEQEIREALVDIPQEVVVIRQEDSVTRKELQAADFIAWAIFQRYEHGDGRFYDIIAEQMIVEEMVEQTLW
jgi:hypothetical protein